MTFNQIQLWESAVAAFDARYQLVEEQHHAMQTPCPDFDVEALIAHATGTQVGIGQIFGSVAAEGASWTEARDAFAAALAVPGAVDGTIDHPALGEVTRERMLAIATNDVLIHAWDLARSLGVDETLPEQNLQPAIDGVEAFPAPARSALFGEPVDVSDAATAQARMLAVAGRHP